jgi:hypothetical protein
MKPKSAERLLLQPFLKCIPEAEKSETRLEAVFQATKAEYNRLRPTFLFYPINA